MRADLPGLKKDDVQVDVTDNAITIHGERREEHQDEREGYFHSEREYGQFYRTIQLVGEVKAEEHLGLIRAAPIELVPVKEPLVLAAARIKARYALSYADAFAVATARMARAPVVTGDPEILSLPRDVVRIRRLQR